MENLISIAELNLSFNNSQVLQNVSFDIETGKIVSIIGPNGAGKTCLAKIILGSLKPDSGKIYKAKGLRFGYMPQRLATSNLLPMTVAEFLSYLTKQKPKIIQKMMKEVEAEHLLSKFLHDLSGGELQKVLFIQALLAKPHVLILDEPTQGLDITASNIFYQKLEQFKAQYKLTVIIISHDLHFVFKNSDDVICLNRKVCCQGKPSLLEKDFAKMDGLNFDLIKLAFYEHDHNKHKTEDYS